MSFLNYSLDENNFISGNVRGQDSPAEGIRERESEDDFLVFIFGKGEVVSTLESIEQYRASEALGPRIRA